MEWYWIVAIAGGGIITGGLLVTLYFLYVFTDGFKDLGPFK